MRKGLRVGLLSMVLSGFGASLGAAQALTSAKSLETVGMALDTRITGWTVREGETDSKEYRPGSRLTAPRATFKATLPAREVLAGIKLEGSPVWLRIRMEARGTVQVVVRVDGTSRQTFTLEGGGGTMVEVKKEIPLVEKANKVPLDVVLEGLNLRFETYCP